MATADGSLMRWMSLPATLASLVVIGMAGCGDAGFENPQVTVRDSAGVTITVSPSELEARPLDWEISPEPDLTIGVAQGDEPYQLFGVDGVAQLPDGRIAVVNRGTQEVRYFDSRGRHLETRGGRGSGPGEFQEPQLVPPVGRDGELLILDLWAGRLTLLHSDADSVRTIMPEPMVRSPDGWDGAGHVLSSRSSAVVRLDSPDGVMDNDYTYESMSLDGGGPVFLSEFPHRLYHANMGGQPWFRRIPFEPEPSASAGDGRFYLTGGSAARIDVYTGEGELVRSIRVDRIPDPVSGAAFDAAVQAELSAISDEDRRREWREHYDRMPVPETMPVYTRLIVDEVAGLWAERFNEDPEAAPAWTVFDPEGIALGTIRTPEGLSITQIGEDFLLGQTIDDLGVERVVRYRLERGGG